MIPETKKCGRCWIEKTKNCFQIRKKPNGYMWLRLECKECQNKKRNEKYAGNHEYRKKVIEKNIEYGSKNREKRLEYYKEYRNKNIELKTAKARNRYIEKSDEIKAKRKIYYYKNKEKVIKLNNDYVERNKSKVRARQRLLHKKKKKEDMAYSILKVLRTRVGAAVKRGGVKCKKTMELVGCSMPKLLSHLEQNFTEGMNWGNYGFKGWHIDHIIPCAKFNMADVEQQKKCFHYTNLQPLWWLDNFKKGYKLNYIAA